MCYFRRRLILVLLMTTVLLAGCSGAAPTTKTYELEPEEAQEVVEPIEEDLLSALATEIQDEMYIFDVVEHHDVLIARIEEEVSAELDEDQMTEQIGKIVSKYMDDRLLDRIRQGISNIQDPYSEDDVLWVKDQISTDDLYHLITVYEREFYKREHAR